jgi:phosphatidylserine/phosphatidylglycerophosphate/cardiolipin synthase-like enzyme
MLSLASTADVAAALGSARSISFLGYMLHPGRVFDALDAAARRGARVEVRVEATPYRAGSLGRLNARMVERLARDGADARVGDAIHTKALTADSVAFYDDCNWLDRGGDTIVRDAPGDPGIATTKGDAIAREVGMLAGARRGDQIELETESFGNGPVSGALARAARAGARVRVLVSSRELRRNPHEAATIASLEHLGVEVRRTGANEKFAVVAARTWVGSANASYGAFDQSDWGAVTDDAAIRAHCESAFEERFQRSVRSR